MKKILLLGAGLVSRPLVRYLLDAGDFSVRVASRTVSKAQGLIDGHERGEALAANIQDDPAAVEELVKTSDVAISLLPAPFHPTVARMCLDHGVNMVTTSYVSPAMKAFDTEAREKGLLLLNEIGVDPGIDHMSAMRVIHAVEKKGGKIVSFRSYCGGLPAPEANTNPIGYKFSWSPRGVLVAATNAARYYDNGELVEIPGPELFGTWHALEVDGAGSFEAYPNRDATLYIDLYGLDDAKTMYRGTLRNTGHCDVWYRWVQLGLFDVTERDDIAGKPFAALMAELAGGNCGADPRAGVAAAMGVDVSDPAVSQLEWLGMFSADAVPAGTNTVLDALAARMQATMPYAEGERDMIVLVHKFEAAYPDGTDEKISSTLVDFGIPGGDSSMARTVSLPAAVAAARLARGEISLTGVRIPVDPEVYGPVLKELEGLGIVCKETFGG